MKWYNSLITRITLVFALALIGVGAVLFIVHSENLKSELYHMQKFANVVIDSAYNHQDNNVNLKLIEESGFELIEDKKLKRQIKKTSQLPTLRELRRSHGREGRSKFFSDHRVRFKTIEYKRNFYIIIRGDLIFKAPHEKNIFPKILLPISAVVLLIFLYIAIVRSILPIYNLRQKVKEFANGNYDVDCSSQKKDEIAILSNEFNKSVQKIKKLRDSRQLFLRNIMHELKTPITKGKLSCEMIEKSTYQEVLKNVFRRQETLLEEFARIEKLSANELDIDTKEYSLQDIVDFSLDILNHDKTSVTCKLQPMSLHVDFELFGTALKNLLDNGINYSNDKRVTIESNKNQIIISNSGKELEFPLENYAQPYFLDAKKAKSSRGLGFGLYITLHVIRLHYMKIEYNREKDRNYFIIDVKKN